MATKNKLAFLTQQAPASYVAGLGRGYVLSPSINGCVADETTFGAFTVHRASPLALILVLPEKVQVRK